MSKKHSINSLSGLVFSTNPDAMIPEASFDTETLPSNQQKLRVFLDKKQRKGKVVTLVEQFIGTTEDLNTLGKTLKTKCGSGGNVKDGTILIQGDFRDKIIIWLKEMGYNNTK